jgi:hypothetical protein
MSNGRTKVNSHNSLHVKKMYKVAKLRTANGNGLTER